MAPAGAGEPMSDKNCKISIIKDGNDSVPKELSTDEIPREISFPSHCATLEVTKVVTGTPPPGTEFSVGVDCGPVLKTLLDRGLVRMIGKKEEAGRPILYGTTPEFLRIFSLKDLAELPTEPAPRGCT